MNNMYSTMNYILSYISCHKDLGLSTVPAVTCFNTNNTQSPYYISCSSSAETFSAGL